MGLYLSAGMTLGKQDKVLQKGHNPEENVLTLVFEISTGSHQDLTIMASIQFILKLIVSQSKTP